MYHISKLKLAFISIIGVLATTALTACHSSDSQVSQDEQPLDFVAASDATSLTSAPDVIENYIYNLSRGEYDLALNLVDLEDGVIFDKDCLQRAVLADGIGRGSDIKFYAITAGRSDIDEDGKEIISDTDICYTVDYSITSGGSEQRTSCEVYYCTNSDGLPRIDANASDWIETGTLKFGVPKYVQVYINDALVPQSLMDKDYVYTVSKGIPKSEGLTLTLKTKFGVEQDYPLSFLSSSGTDEDGNEITLSPDKIMGSVNDDYYSEDLGLSYFTIDIPRELRENITKYLQNELLPVLVHDQIQGIEYESSSFRNFTGADTNTAAISPRYNASARKFKSLSNTENGYFFYEETPCYNISCSDEKAYDEGYSNLITDYNELKIFVSFAYNYDYSINSSSKKTFTGTKNALFTLSVDDDGKLYLKDLTEDGFGLGVD